MIVENRTKKDKFKYNFKVILLILLSIFLLAIPMSLAAVFLHELGHMLAILVIFPDSSSTIATLSGYASYNRYDQEFWQSIIISGAGPIASLIVVIVSMKFILPKVEKERVILRICLWLLVFASINNSTGYFAQTFFFDHGDTASIANDIDWIWGLSFPNGELPIDTAIILTIIGIITSIPICIIAYRGLRKDLSNYFKDFISIETKRERIIYNVKLFILLPIIAGLCWLFTHQLLPYLDFSNTIYIGAIWELSSYSINGLIWGSLFLGVIFLILLGNKYIIGKLKEEMRAKNARIMVFDAIIIFFFLIFPYFGVIRPSIDDYQYDYGLTNSYFTGSQYLYEFNPEYNETTCIWSYGVRLSSSPSSTPSNFIRLYQNQILSEQQGLMRSISPIMLPDDTLWVISCELPDLRTDPNAKMTFYATSYNFTGITPTNAPTSLAWTNRTAINYTGETTLSSSNIKAYFNSECGEIWVVYKYYKVIGESTNWFLDLFQYCYTREIIVSSDIYFARINPNTSTIIENKKLDAEFGDYLLHTQSIVFSGDDALLYHHSSSGINATQLNDNFTVKGTSKTVYTELEGEMVSHFFISGNCLIVPSMNNRDLWVSRISLVDNYKVLNTRVRLTSDYVNNYAESGYTFNNVYYVRGSHRNVYFNKVCTTYNSSDGAQWHALP